MDNRHKSKPSPSPKPATKVHDADYPFVWRSISVHFTVSRFLRQLLVHSLLPLTTIFSPNLVAQTWWLHRYWTPEGGSPGHLLRVVINHIIGSITTMDIALYLSMMYLEPDDAAYFQGSFIFPVLFSYLWKFAVAVKYGKRGSEKHVVSCGFLL
jgi:hypothetical protein